MHLLEKDTRLMKLGKLNGGRLSLCHGLSNARLFAPPLHGACEIQRLAKGAVQEEARSVQLVHTRPHAVFLSDKNAEHGEGLSTFHALARKASSARCNVRAIRAHALTSRAASNTQALGRDTTTVVDSFSVTPHAQTDLLIASGPVSLQRVSTGKRTSALPA